MDDIRPPKRPTRPPKEVAVDHRIAGPPEEPRITAHATDDGIVPESLVTRQPISRRKIIVTMTGLIAVFSLIGAIASYFLYQQALSPVSNNTQAARISLTIETGSTPSQIGDLLVQKQLIRSKTAFDIYTRLGGTQNKLQAGSYRLSPAESTPEIVKHLVSGKVDEFTLTFYPGATLTDTTSKAANKKVDVTTILSRAGYSKNEIGAALKKTYDHPVFATKPATADLEGYIYGETYNFSSSASVEDILVRTFDELYKEVKDSNLEAGFKAQGLSLYEGITLASIVQREVGTPEDQKQVAAVFYNRIKDGMKLGSDVTYHYAADKLGVARDFTLDSPYNTRKYTGLPPSPIAAPGASALQATAYPGTNSYLFFLSGDDNKTYFGKTDAEHEANIRNHCTYKCSLP